MSTTNIHITGYRADIDDLNRHDREQLAMYFCNANILWHDLMATFIDAAALKNTRFTGNFWLGPQASGNSCPTVFDATTFQLGVDGNGRFFPEGPGESRAFKYLTVDKISDDVLRDFLIHEYQQYGKIREHMESIKDSMKLFDNAIHYNGLTDIEGLTP